MKCYAIENSSLKLDGGAMFGNAPKELWRRWTACDELNRIPLAARSLLIQTDDGQNILFEAGDGSFFEPPLKKRYGIDSTESHLLANLAALGITENDIDIVVLSHLHFDHACGLIPPYGQVQDRLFFPKAQYFTGKRQWQHGMNPPNREKASFIPLLFQLLQDSNRLQFIEDKGIPELPNVRFHYSDGHTVGLVVSEIAYNNQTIVFTSDLAPGLAWTNVSLSMGYDRYAELIVEEKRKLFEELIDKQPLLFYTHDPSVACAKLLRDSNGKFSAEPTNLP